jgi:hypothetical protein
MVAVQDKFSIKLQVNAISVKYKAILKEQISNFVKCALKIFNAMEINFN